MRKPVPAGRRPWAFPKPEKIKRACIHCARPYEADRVYSPILKRLTVINRICQMCKETGLFR
jgi:hypothetical protein